MSEICNLCGEVCPTRQALGYHFYLKHSDVAGMSRKEATVMRICARLQRYTYADVMTALDSSRKKRHRMYPPTEHEVQQIISKASWSVQVGEVYDRKFRLRRNVYMYVDPKTEEEP
jgi:hypothetical protein